MAVPYLALRLDANLGVFLILVAAALWGTAGTAQAFAPLHAPPLVIGALRLIVGGTALVIFAGSQGLLRHWRALPLWPTGVAGLSMAMYQLCFFAGIKLTGVATGTVIAIGSAPLLAGLLSWLVFRQPPGVRWAIATALAIAGCGCLTFSGGSLSRPQIHLDLFGLLLVFGAGASYAVYTLYSKKILDHVPADLVAAAVFGLGGCLLLPILAVADLSLLTHRRGIGVVLELGLFATALAYILYTRGLADVPVPTAVTLALGEPVVASLLGIFVLGERLSAAGWVGMGLVFTGLLWLTTQPRG